MQKMQKKMQPHSKKCKMAQNAKKNAFAYLALPCLIGIFPINTRNSWDTWLFLGCWPFLGHWLLLGHRLFLRHRLILEHWLFLGQNPQILVFIFYRCKTVFYMFQKHFLFSGLGENVFFSIICFFFPQQKFFLFFLLNVFFS